MLLFRAILREGVLTRDNAFDILPAYEEIPILPAGMNVFEKSAIAHFGAPVGWASHIPKSRILEMKEERDTNDWDYLFNRKNQGKVS